MLKSLLTNNKRHHKPNDNWQVSQSSPYLLPHITGLVHHPGQQLVAQDPIDWGQEPDPGQHHLVSTRHLPPSIWFSLYSRHSPTVAVGWDRAVETSTNCVASCQRSTKVGKLQEDAIIIWARIVSGFCGFSSWLKSILKYHWVMS